MPFERSGLLFHALAGHPRGRRGCFFLARSSAPPEPAVASGGPPPCVRSQRPDPSPAMRRGPERVRGASGLLVLLWAAACAPVSPATTHDLGEAGRISFWSLTLDMRQFLSGAAGGAPAEVWGELQFPRREARRVPAVILVHSAAGAGPHEWRWAKELNGIGVATLVLDSFSGRGLRNIRELPLQFSPILAIMDAYQALEL